MLVLGGLIMWEVIFIVWWLCVEINLVGFDIVELVLVLDIMYVSILNVNSLMFVCLIGVVMYKKGII